MSDETSAREGLGDESHNALMNKKQQTDPEYYYRLRQRGKTHQVAAKMAGYSPKTQERYIMSTKKIKAIVSSVDEMRRINQRRPGHTYLDNAEVLQEIRDDDSVSPGVRIQALKEHNAMHGYHAAKELKSSNLHLHAELECFEEEELEEMLKDSAINADDTDYEVLD